MKISLNKKKLILIAIILLGAFFRFYDLNFDQNQHLHPDERFLTLVATAMQVPPTLLTYLDPQKSTMNPALIGYTFYVYGIFPVVLDKILAIFTGNNTYNGVALLGRAISGFLDLLLVVIIFKTVELFEKRYKLQSNVKYWAAFFYAISVLPIQLSHYFAVDTFLNSFVYLSFYTILRFSFTKHYRWLILGGIFLGLAFASKATAIFIAPLLLYFFVNTYAEKRKVPMDDLKRIFMDLIFFGAVTYVVGRIADPYLFQSGNFFDVQISKLFISNLKQLQGFSAPDAWFPPGVQWIHKTPIIFGLKNLTIYGIGIGSTMCVLLGIYYLFRKIRALDLFVTFAWVLVFSLYQSLQSVQTMRYFLILYPFLAILAGIGFTYFAKQTNKYIQAILLFIVILWPLLFFSIYTKPITRVSASEWIYTHIPQKSVILTESWDDALPLPLDGIPTSVYTIQELPIFDPDTQQKWQKMDSMLSQGDYYILSSNRGWGSIPTVPQRYPKMTKFYQDLFAGKTDYKKVAEFTSYPSLDYLGIPITIPDDNAEEAFTVYDHPVVMIFKHIRR
jgi:4-amino-4-deoxy-L-arabinose transferase-like glycosyltransferase